MQHNVKDRDTSRLIELERIRAEQAVAILRKDREIEQLRTKVMGLNVLARIATMTDADV